MEKKLFLLDGMGLVYRAHFALIARPIFNSKGVNTSALYGFTQTLLEILRNQQPTHIAVAFDSDKPTERHAQFAEYKATRQAMPEDLTIAIPAVLRMLQAFRIQTLTCEGYEADDLIGTLVRRAQLQGFTSFMVTSDKDFAQLVTESIFLYKPGRMGDPAQILGSREICTRWGVSSPEQVIDILALMGDSIDNIPGVPGIGEKTAIKLISQFGSVENVIARADELSGKTRESILKFSEQALLSKRLVTLHCNVPCEVDLQSLRIQQRDDEMLKSLFVEFEFSSIGRRLFGEDFKIVRGRSAKSGPAQPSPELELFSTPPVAPSPPAKPKTLAEVPHDYSVASSAAERARLVKTLSERKSVGVAVLGSSPEAKEAALRGVAFALEPHRAVFVPIDSGGTLAELRPVLESRGIEKVGHDLKYAVSVMKWHQQPIRGPLFDVMLAHSLIEPEMRHTLDYISEVYLGYSALPFPEVKRGVSGDGSLFSPESAGQSAGELFSVSQAEVEWVCERADVALRLRDALESLLREKAQERVFYEIECPLIAVLADMEYEGIRVDAAALAEFGNQLAKEIDQQEKAICQLAGTVFNINSPRQLGQILFEVLKICDAPKKTKTGQFATDEQTLAALAPDHEIVRRLLEHRAATKLKSTYADALPVSIWPATGRVHTTYQQLMTATGRLNSQNPNLQNIPIRTQRGQEIRRAFVPRSPEFLLMSADYSQIELRIIAALSREPGLLEAFQSGADVHTATAARVFGVAPAEVTNDMRRKAKMVNYGIAYGISSFGLAQRLGIARKEASEIIDHYFSQFPGIRQYMDETIAFARKNGYVTTVTGRRRYLRDINSSNGTIRSAAERNAINAPIQGTAADMIKLAMLQIHGELTGRNLGSRLLLQVHDELVFDVFVPERESLSSIVRDKMQNALPLRVPIEVEIGVGSNWLEAH